MNRSSANRILQAGVALAVVAAWCLAARAELSPDVYRKLQKEAPEDLEIDVQRVTTTETPTAAGTEVEVEGFGILLAKHYVDELIYNEVGNEVFLIKWLGERRKE